MAAQGVATLAASHAFQGRKEPGYSPRECRGLLEHAASTSSINARAEADLLAALVTDAAVKDDKAETVAPTALCLLQGQGHQHFLHRLASVPHTPAPPPRGYGKQAVRLSPADCLEEALFYPPVAPKRPEIFVSLGS